MIEIINNATSWNEILEMNDPLNFTTTFLDSNLLTSTQSKNEMYGIMYSTSGMISTVSSAALIAYILRSNDGLTKTLHRLLFGLSIGDISSSIMFSLGPLMIPKEMDYIIPFANGNATTCTIQGIFIDFGTVAAMAYNCCLCIYYLAIIKYNKNDEYIQKKLEPFFHGISITIPLIFASIPPHTYDAYVGGHCKPSFFISSPPPHCIGREVGEIVEGFSSIPCVPTRATSDNITASDIVSIMAGPTIFIIVPCIIVGSMISMYRFISKIEDRMSSYGEGALNVDNNRENNDDDSDDNNNRSKCGLIGCVLLSCCFQSNGCRSKMKSQSLSPPRRMSSKREVLYRAIAYASAWAIIWIPSLIAVILTFSPQEKLTVLGKIIRAVMVPLQGLANFIVFMFPKVKAIKLKVARRSKKLTWFQAFIKAYASKGGGGGSSSNSNNSSSQGSERSSNNNASSQSILENFWKFIAPNNVSTSSNTDDNC